jgi:hypothetical protein
MLQETQAMSTNERGYEASPAETTERCRWIEVLDFGVPMANGSDGDLQAAAHGRGPSGFVTLP